MAIAGRWHQGSHAKEKANHNGSKADMDELTDQKYFVK
jgi:hypothetical protein